MCLGGEHFSHALLVGNFFLKSKLLLESKLIVETSLLRYNLQATKCTHHVTTPHQV